MFSVYFVFLVAVASALASSAGFGVLYVIILICWIQNLLLPWWYTIGWMSADTALASLLLKEVLLVFVLIYAVLRLTDTSDRGFPLPIKVALWYAAYVVARTVVGSTLLGESVLENARLLRSMLFPAEVLLVSFIAGVAVRRLPWRYERLIVNGLTVAAAIGVVLFLRASDTFWADNVNIAAYNVEVKGDSQESVLWEAGVSGTGAARDAFQWLSQFRLIGTFGDPLTAGLALSTGLLLVVFRDRLTGLDVFRTTLIGVAIVLTFSRSAWILVAVACLVGFVARRMYGRLLLMGLAAAALWVSVGGLRTFFFESIATFGGVQAGDVRHAEGILQFYSASVLEVESTTAGSPSPIVTGVRPASSRRRR